MGTHPIFESDFDCLTDKMAKGKKGKKKGFLADLEDELENPELVKELEAAEIEPVLSKSQLKKQKRNQKKQAAAAISNMSDDEEEEAKGKPAFAAMQVSDEEEEEEEEEIQKPPKK